MAVHHHRSPTLQQLLEETPLLWRGRGRSAPETQPSGYSELDTLLPGRGWPIGALVELAPSNYGIGELSLPLPVLRSMANSGRPVALVRPPYIPYARGLWRAGVPLDRVLWIEKEADQEARWAAEQLLRDGAGAVLLWTATADDRLLRRLQLAAEVGRSIAFVYRPQENFQHVSPAAVRIKLQTSGNALRVEVVKVRGGTPGAITLTLPWGWG